MKKIFKNSHSLGCISILGMVLVCLCGPPHALGADPVKIAVIAALSGPAGTIGQSQLEGAKVAEKEINDQGGILGRKIMIIERDTAASPATAVKVTQELAMGKEADYFVGVVSSAVALAIAPVIEQNNALLILAAAQTEKSTGSQCSPNVFRITTNAVAVARAAAKLMVDRYPGVNRWAGINPDYEYGRSCWTIFKEELKRLNPNAVFVAELWPKFNATSFESEILQLVDAKPEAMYSSLFASDFITFAKQASKYKLFDNIKAFMDHSVASDVAIPLGENMVDVWGGGHYHHDAFNNEQNTKFLKTHREMYKKDPVYAASESYTAVHAIKLAAEKAKSLDVKAVMGALEGMYFDSVTGKRFIRHRDHQTIRAQIFSHFVPVKENPGWKIAEHATIMSEDVYPRWDEEEYRCVKKK
jgi:branched-chain amino acid transport system substrate-binding protein